MPTVTINDKGCRGCSMCIDECPVLVFDRAPKSKTGGTTAKVSRSDDCIGCFACYYLCPSQCIQISDVEIQRPFYRIDENISFVERFLGVSTTTKDLTGSEWEEAYKDVSMTLVSLSKAAKSIVGSGINTLGRKAGVMAASHIPEVFEEPELIGRLKRLQQRFRHSFNFDFEIEGRDIKFTFAPCGVLNIVEKETTEKVGDAVLCHLFHHFLAGLVSTYSGITYRHTTIETGSKCMLVLSPK